MCISENTHQLKTALTVLTTKANQSIKHTTIIKKSHYEDHTEEAPENDLLKLIVKIVNKLMIKCVRKTHMTELLKEVNQKIRFDSATQTVSDLQYVVSNSWSNAIAVIQQLKSDNLKLTASSINVVNTLQQHKEWVTIYELMTNVLTLTYGVIIHFIQIKNINIATDKSKIKMINKFVALNYLCVFELHLINDIRYLDWLTSESHKQ